MSGRIFAYVTGDCTTFKNDGSEDYTQEFGYVDPAWSREVLHESRNDVKLLLNESEDAEDFAEMVRDVFDAAPGGPFHDNGDGTFYGQSAHTDSEGRSWTYAVHFTRKFFKSGTGWTEESWHPGDILKETPA